MCWRAADAAAQARPSVPPGIPTVESLPFSPALSRMFLASLHQVIADATGAAVTVTAQDAADIEVMHAQQLAATDMSFL